MELAIVLVIVGLILGIGMSMMGPLTERAKYRESKEVVEGVYDAIIGYGMSNRVLPSSLSTLGIRTKDAYGRDVEYYFVSEFSSSDFCTTQGTYFTVDDKGTTKSNVAFIVISSGKNVCNQTGTSSPFSIYEQGVVVACGGNSDARYDDIVMYEDINGLRERVCNAFRVVTETLPIGKEEILYSGVTLQATDGTTPYSWSVLSGSLPSGLSLSSGGQISGTPISDGTYAFIVSVTDAEGRTASKSLSITINPNDPEITTTVLNYGEVGSTYTATLAAGGGTGTYTWEIISGSLPPGLSFSDGVISGTPTQAGTYTFTVRITDQRGRTAEKTLSIAING